jgi:hypothetical protein
VKGLARAFVLVYRAVWSHKVSIKAQPKVGFYKVSKLRKKGELVS